MFETVECPYCEHDNDMSEGLVDLPSDNKFDHECEKCGKTFEVEVEFDPSYSGSKIIYEKCDKCQKETRDPFTKGRVFPFPKNLKGEVFCRTCFYESVREEYAKPK